MGKWNEQQGLLRERKECERSRKENLSKFFYDLAKLTFAGVVIGGIIPLFQKPNDLSQWSMVVTGVFSTAMIAYFANNILKN